MNTDVTSQVMAILGNLDPTEAKRVLREVASRLIRREMEIPHPTADVAPEVVWEAFRSHKGFYSGSWSLIDQIGTGLGRVEFSLENYECEEDSTGNWGSLLGPRHFGKIAGVGCCGGGDWEYPLFFVIYLDADGKTLRSYVPKNGNIWNYEAESAFGNNDNDAEFFVKWLTEQRPSVLFDPARFDSNRHPQLMFDEAKILQDIAEHFDAM